MPVAFFGHGNPINAITDNAYARGWRAMANTMPTPRAILMISAHWYLPGTRVTAHAHPPTIHDFGGFPAELYETQYPAPGSPELARVVADALAPLDVTLDAQRGLDHGAWAVLTHAYADASIPVVQLSIDETQPPRFHFECGQRLRPFRHMGVLIAGSGNLVHNLPLYAWGAHAQEPYDWALRFERLVRDLLVAREFDPLVDYEALGGDALLSVPTPEHYLPLLYVLGASDEDDLPTFPVAGIEGGSISMLSALFTS